MGVYRLTNRARRDLKQIWRTIAEDSAANADRFIERLVRNLALLGSNPYLGRRRDELRRGYRSFPVGRYVIFYRVRKPGVEIAHVMHGARDLEALLGSR